MHFVTLIMLCASTLIYLEHRSQNTKIRKGTATPNDTNAYKKYDPRLQYLPKRVAKQNFANFHFAAASTRVLADFAARLPLLLFCNKT